MPLSTSGGPRTSRPGPRSSQARRHPGAFPESSVPGPAPRAAAPTPGPRNPADLYGGAAAGGEQQALGGTGAGRARAVPPHRQTDLLTSARRQRRPGTTARARPRPLALEGACAPPPLPPPRAPSPLPPPARSPWAHARRGTKFGLGFRLLWCGAFGGASPVRLLTLLWPEGAPTWPAVRAALRFSASFPPSSAEPRLVSLFAPWAGMSCS